MRGLAIEGGTKGGNVRLLKDLKLVATRLGHSNETMVLRVYGHLLPGTDREAARRLGELVKRRAP